ncbi:MAG TPA: glycosyltransferase family 4 protein [Anaerolineaceae bacterium]|nr:glycosyltransferase family 4 protein [Anaerolineaceae bacterium]
MKIGVLAYRFNYYTNKRTIVAKVPEAKYVPVRDLYSIERNLGFRLNQLFGAPLIPTFNLNNQFEDFDLNRVDLIHLSNGISYGKTPWISSFETILPRFTDLVARHQEEIPLPALMTPLVERGLTALAGKPCKNLLPWSECSAAMQRDLLTSFPTDYSKPILAKMKVLHPPQDLLVEAVNPREYSNATPIRFILVGEAFFRKGGKELLLAFEKLVKEEHLPIKLVVVSSLRLEPYAAHETEKDVQWAKKIFADNPDWVEYFPSLPNDKVLELMKSCDVGLLPTWADTYGISVLEAQACGLPVITTDSRALPEMNNNRVGWLINVPQNRLKEALYNTEENRNLLGATIQAGLEDIIRQIVANPEQIAEKGGRALEKIRTDHDPAQYANKMRAIYREALS